MNNHLIIILQPFEVINLPCCECHEGFTIVFQQVVPHRIDVKAPSREGVIHPRSKQPFKIIKTPNLGQYRPLCHPGKPKLGTTSFA